VYPTLKNGPGCIISIVGQWRPEHTLLGRLIKKVPLHLGAIKETWSLEHIFSINY